MQQQSNAQAVKEFTEGSNGVKCPTTPQPMNRENVLFITRMIISELDELLCTVAETPSERDELLHKAVNTRDRCNNFEYATRDELVGAQFDALVDAWYYSLNIAAKHGVNMSKIFDLVHKANMDKRDPETGKFIRRESDGKVIKPAGWQPPDITAEIKRQTEFGNDL